MARNRLWAFLKKVAADIDDQVWNRTGPHGSAELGAALFNNGHAYVMYGNTGRPGEVRRPEEPPQQKAEQVEKTDPDRGQERKGRER